MKLPFLILMLPVACFGQHPLLTASGIDWTRASSAANITNFPVTVLNAEHFWLASDLPQATMFPSSGWRDRIVDVGTNAWITNTFEPGQPTNRSTGLQFIGTESLILSNSTVGVSNISITNSAKRAVFMVFSTVVNTREYFLGGDIATGNFNGIWWNNSGVGNTASGRRVYHDTGGTAHDIGGKDDLKTDGTVQDVGLIGTTPATPIIDGYTNGVIAVSGVNGATPSNFSSLGTSGTFGFQGKVLAIITAINPTPAATWFSNAHYWSTNIFGLGPP